MTARLAAYGLIAVVGIALIASIVSWQEREDGRLEEREQAAVAHAQRWHKSYVIARDSTHKMAKVANNALALSRALRDSVRIVNDTTLVVDTLRVTVPQVVVRRLVADSVTIDRLTALTAVQEKALTVADSTMAASQVALHAAQANRCRIVWKVPCPSRKTTALLTAGTLLVAKAYLGSLP